MKFLQILLLVSLSAPFILCQKPERNAMCNLPLDIGPCRGAKPRYYYEPKTKSCEYFLYGGCEGNANNFKTKLDCEKACSSRKA